MIRLATDERPWDIVFSPRSPHLVGVFLLSDHFRLWELPCGKERLRVGFHTNVISLTSPLEISNDGNVLVFHYHAVNFSGVWSHLETGASPGQVEVTSLPLFPTGTTLAISADGRTLVSLGENLRRWNLGNWPPNEISRQPIRGSRMALSPDVARIAIGQDNRGSVSICEPVEGHLLTTLLLTNSLHRLAWSADGKWLATMTAHPSRVVLWDAITWELVYAFKAFRTWGHSLAFSPDSRLLVAGANDGIIHLWDVESGREQALDWQIGRVRRVCFAPDGMTAAALGDTQIVIWDVD